MGANNRHPLPHAAKEQPADDVPTVIVGFPPSSTPPCNPFPSSSSSYSLLSLYSSSSQSSWNRHSPSYSPLPPPLPLPSHHRPRLNASANPSRSLDMYDPWSARRMPIARSAVSSPDDGPVRTITSLRISPGFSFTFGVSGIRGGGVGLRLCVVAGGGCDCAGGVSR